MDTALEEEHLSQKVLSLEFHVPQGNEREAGKSRFQRLNFESPGTFLLWASGQHSVVRSTWPISFPSCGLMCMS